MQGAPQDLLAELGDAVPQLDRPRVAALCRALVSHLHQTDAPLPRDEAAQVLALLRTQRFFPQMQAVADALLQTGQDAPAVRCQYAQALIEQGVLSAAAAVLRELLDATPLRGAEARGLLGRALKQQYVAAGRPNAPPLRAALREAVREYYKAYRSPGAWNYWHGINAVACAARARRDGVAVDAAVDERQIAGTILARLRQDVASAGGGVAPFELATALEACVALHDVEGAAAFAERYADSPASAFELASTLRQLTEVWQLDSTHGVGRAVLPILRSALLQRETGHVEVSAADVAFGVAPDAAGGPARFRSLAWYRAGLARARLVARITTRWSGQDVGTGFLVRGEDVAERYRGRRLLVANAHVLNPFGGRHLGVRPSDARVTFEATARDGAPPRSYGVGAVLWASDMYELDTALTELDAPVEGVDEADYGEFAEGMPAGVASDRIYIIGHPAGRPLSYSLQDNIVLGCRSPRLHYRTPTEPGSSGSPLFDDAWRLVGIHHMGRDDMPRLDGAGTYQANEGMSIHAIRSAVRACPDAGA